jgi:hypothetical protein
MCGARSRARAEIAKYKSQCVTSLYIKSAMGDVTLRLVSAEEVQDDNDYDEEETSFSSALDCDSPPHTPALRRHESARAYTGPQSAPPKATNTRDLFAQLRSRTTLDLMNQARSVLVLSRSPTVKTRRRARSVDELFRNTWLINNYDNPEQQVPSRRAKLYENNNNSNNNNNNNNSGFQSVTSTPVKRRSIINYDDDDDNDEEVSTAKKSTVAKRSALSLVIQKSASRDGAPATTTSTPPPPSDVSAASTKLVKDGANSKLLGVDARAKLLVESICTNVGAVGDFVLVHTKFVPSALLLSTIVERLSQSKLAASTAQRDRVSLLRFVRKWIQMQPRLFTADGALHAEFDALLLTLAKSPLAASAATAAAASSPVVRTKRPTARDDHSFAEPKARSASSAFGTLPRGSSAGAPALDVTNNSSSSSSSSARAHSATLALAAATAGGGGNVTAPTSELSAAALRSTRDIALAKAMHDESGANEPKPFLPKNVKSEIALLDLHPLEIARQITLAQWQIFKVSERVVVYTRCARVHDLRCSCIRR